MVILFPIKRREKAIQKINIEITKVDLKDCENNYGIDHLKIGEATHNLDDFKLLLAQRMIAQMENKISNNKSLTH